MKTSKKVRGQGLEDLLKLIRPLREKASSRVRERAVATTSAEAFQKLKARGLDKLIDLHLAESPPELMDLAKSYNHVSLVGEDMEGAQTVWSWPSLWRNGILCPRRSWDSIRKTLRPCWRQSKRLQGLQAADVTDFQEWQDLEKLIVRLNESGDGEGARLARLASRLGGCVSEAASFANEELKRKIEKSSLTLGGTDLLLVMSRGEGIRELFEMQMKGRLPGGLAGGKSACCQGSGAGGV